MKKAICIALVALALAGCVPKAQAQPPPVNTAPWHVARWRDGQYRVICYVVEDNTTNAAQGISCMPEGWAEIRP